MRLVTFVSLAGLVVLAGCGMQFKPAPVEPPRESVFGPGGLIIGARPPGTEVPNPSPSGITVNAYLWQAALQVVADRPVLQADPHGGVILVDWHSLAGVPNERFRMNIAITSDVLASTSFRVDILRQVRDGQGEWVGQPVALSTEQAFEDALLATAQALRAQAEGPVEG